MKWTRFSVSRKSRFSFSLKLVLYYPFVCRLWSSKMAYNTNRLRRVEIFSFCSLHFLVTVICLQVLELSVFIIDEILNILLANPGQWLPVLREHVLFASLVQALDVCIKVREKKRKKSSTVFEKLNHHLSISQPLFCRLWKKNAEILTKSFEKWLIF